MGMFDDVTYTAPCAKCGHKLTDWQSKSGPCALLRLNPVDVTNFYTSCPKCKQWNEYDVKGVVVNIVRRVPPLDEEF